MGDNMNLADLHARGITPGNLLSIASTLGSAIIAGGVILWNVSAANQRIEDRIVAVSDRLDKAEADRSHGDDEITKRVGAMQKQITDFLTRAALPDKRGEALPPSIDIIAAPG